MGVMMSRRRPKDERKNQLIEQKAKEAAKAQEKERSEAQQKERGKKKGV